MAWNGLSLVNDFSAELGDTSSQFKTKVLGWVNDGIKDIATSHNWPFLREKGKVVLALGSDTHRPSLAKPAAPVVTIASGGSLTVATTYRILVTFYEAQSGVESIAGESSSNVLTAGANLQIDVTSLPISTSPLVTERRIYLSKANASFAYHSTVADNTTLIATVSSETTSQITPPEESYLNRVDGDFYLENNRIIQGTSLQNLIVSTNGVSSSGTPSAWAPINHDEIKVYPKPSVNTTASFYYFKLPAKVFGITASVPQIPSWLYDDLRNYVIHRGYAFRDRAGTESKKLNYDQGLASTINKKGKPVKASGRIRCVTPDSDGYGI